jgi:hypothetical protein
MNSDLAFSLHPLAHKDINRETVVYEAGHAAAIYLGNQQRQLPPVFFQIALTQAKGNHEWIATIDGGRLIHTLPSSIAEATREFSETEQQAYRHAFEADIVNLLVGPLAEAKYSALARNEPVFKAYSNAQAGLYKKLADFEIIQEYFSCFIADKTERINKITELFLTALNFINNPVNWRAIMGLADYILRAGKDSIDCEEAAFIISQQLA